MNKAKIYPWIFTVTFGVIITVLLSNAVFIGCVCAQDIKEEYELLWEHSYSRFMCNHGNIRDIKISNNGNYVAVSWDSWNGDIFYFDKEGKLLKEEPTNNWLNQKIQTTESSYSDLVDNYLEDYKCMITSPKGNYILLGGRTKEFYHHAVIILLKEKREVIWKYDLGCWSNQKWDGIQGMALSQNANYIVVGCYNEMSNEDADHLYFFAKLSIIASNKISEAKSTISQTKSKGVVVTEAEEQLSEAEQSFDTKDYRKAMEFAQRANDLTAKLDEDAKSAEEAVGTAKSIISDAKSKGFKLSDAENFLSQAENAFNSGDYTNAKSLAEQAKEKAEEINKLAAPANDAINDAKSAIHTEESKGFYSAEAESLFSQAEQAFKTGHYEKAKSLAENATILAFDIDQDGVKNEEDFAPTTRNIYIYTGTPAVLLVLAALTKVSLDVRRRGMKKRLERERIRREEGRERLEYERRISELKAKYEQYKREGYKPDSDLEEMLK